MKNKYKVVLAAAVCAVVSGSSPAYAINMNCVTFVNNSANNVGFQAYDTNDAVMWVALNPGISDVPARGMQRLCFESAFKQVKVWYQSYSTKSVQIKTSANVTGQAADGSGGSASAAYEGPIDVAVPGAGQGLVGVFGDGACVFIGKINKNSCSN